MVIQREAAEAADGGTISSNTSNIESVSVSWCALGTAEMSDRAGSAGGAVFSTRGAENLPKIAAIMAWDGAVEIRQ